MKEAAFVFLVSMVATCAIVRMTIAWALRRKMLDVPNERSSHVRPTPRGGGVGIVLVVLVAATLLCLLPGFPADPRGWLTFIFCGLVIAVVSWLDDVRGLSNGARFAAHSICAMACMVALGVPQSVELPWVGQVPLAGFAWPLAYLWIVGLTNAFNFMDGIDGIAGGQAFVAGMAWAGLGSLEGAPLITYLGLAIAGAAGGFLLYNWSPARIFMGDVGSAFLGFTLAVMPLLAAPHARGKGADLVCAALLVWPFVFDATFTFFRRLFNGENVLTAHRSHLYQRLVIVGKAHNSVAALYIGLAVIGSIVAIVRAESSAWEGLAVLPALFLGLWYWVRLCERRFSRKT
jgi:UDP-N-acetylmuramyl pentapeptide phosphotransferase/UDP-N-acetylglucosamine-1-phosphate transferase